jgi:hypothetical protein
MTIILDGTTGITSPDLEVSSGGSAAAPAITVSGDTNTGIFFPAADTIAFAEGGAEAMRIDSSGNLGLGVTPSAWGSNFRALQVGQSGYLFSGTATTFMDIGSNAYFDGSNYKYVVNGTAGQFVVNNAGKFEWLQAPSGTAGNNITFTTSMVLDSSGNVGIGTSSPQRKFDILSDGGQFRLSDTDGSHGEMFVNGGLYIIRATGDGATATINGTLRFDTTSSGTTTERARITSGGDLLVGTTSSDDTNSAGGRLLPWKEGKGKNSKQN